MGIAEDIKRLRDAGRSDDEILSGIQKVAPHYGEDITKLQAARKSPTDIVNGIQAYDTANRPGADKGIIARVTDPFRQGVANVAEGIASTVRQVSDQKADTPQEGVTSRSLRGLAKNVAPDNYEAAAPSLSNLGDVPKAVAEGAPGYAVDIPAMLAGGRIGAGIGAMAGSVVPVIGTTAGAALGGIGGGLAGLGSSMWARSYGSSVRDAATARTGDANVQPNAEDKLRANSSIAAQTLLSRVGIKAGMGTAATAAGGSVLGQVGKQAAVAAGVNGLTEAAGEGINQALVDRKFNREKLEGAFLTGGATAAGMRGIAGVKDFNAERKFAGLTPEDAKSVVSKLQAEHGEDYRGSPEQDGAAMKKVRQDLQTTADNLVSDPNISQFLKDRKAADQYDTTATTLDIVRNDIKEGRAPKPADLEHLQKTIGTETHGQDLLATLRDQIVTNRIVKLGHYDEKAGTLTGGLAGSPFAQKFLSPTHGKWGLGGLLGAGTYALAGHTLPGMSFMHALGDPVNALALPAAQIGTYSALVAGGKLTGNNNPSKLFLDRFSEGKGGAFDALRPPELSSPTPPPEPTPGPRPPSYMDKVNAAKAMQRTIATNSKSQAALAVAAARKAERARIAMERRAETAQAPQATPMAPEGPMPVSEAPRGPSVDLPETTSITHRDGTRQQVNGDVRNRMSAVANGVNTRATARREILESAFELPLSKSGLEKLGAGSDGILERVFRTSDQTKAKGMLENFLETLSNADEAIIRNHLRNHTDPATGHTFYSTWE